MIHIIFISPDAFEKLGKQFGDQDGLEDLRELLFPRRSEPNVLLADPHKENWIKEVSRRAMRLPSQTRGKAMKLLERLAVQSLVGWTSDGTAPVNEVDWIKLVNSDKRRHVDHTFASEVSLCSETTEPVERFSDEEWLRGQFPWSKTVARCRASQLPIFQKLLIDVDWCIAELPYVEGSGSDEIVTLKQLIDVMCQTPGTSPLSLDLVTMQKKKNLHWRPDLRAKLEAALDGSHKVKSCRKIKLRVFAIDDYKDRYFMVGNSVTIAGGQSKREPRRCIAAQHVAIGRDRPTDSSTWTLCNSVDTKNRFKKLNADMATPGALVFELP